MIDAPVSGGVAGAQAATLTFMVGGSEAAFARAKPILAQMGKTIVHAGGRRQRTGGEDLQQHDPRRVDDRGVGSFRAGREARPRRAEAVRHLVEIVRPVLVDDELLPGAGPGAGLARQPRLPGGLHRRDDAQGSEARPGGRAAAGAATPMGAQAAALYERYCGRGEAGKRFLRHHPDAARRAQGAM